MENLPKTIIFKSKEKTNTKIFSLSLLLGDVTNQDTNIIVNAANKNLWLGGGVAGAVRRRGGDEISKECNYIFQENKRPFKTCDIISTGKGNFPGENVKNIFHAIGPYYTGKNNSKKEKKLEKCFINVITLANLMKKETISIPPISSGMFHFPKDLCAEIFMDVIFNYAKLFIFDNEIYKEKFCENIKRLIEVNKFSKEELFFEEKKNIASDIKEKKENTLEDLFPSVSNIKEIEESNFIIKEFVVSHINMAIFDRENYNIFSKVFNEKIKQFEINELFDINIIEF